MRALAIGIIFLQKLSQSDKDFKRYELEEVWRLLYHHGIAVYPFLQYFKFDAVPNVNICKQFVVCLLMLMCKKIMRSSGYIQEISCTGTMTLVPVIDSAIILRRRSTTWCFKRESLRLRSFSCKNYRNLIRTSKDTTLPKLQRGGCTFVAWVRVHVLRFIANIGGMRNICDTYET